MKNILLTGATDGIGLETAKTLVQEGHRLLLHGRSVDKLAQVRAMLLAHTPEAQIELYTADFSQLQDVRDMAEAIKAKHTRLDVLINNAGVFVLDAKAQRTASGLDKRFMVNTVAPYVLTKALLPLLHKESRVVNLGSAAQAPVDFAALAEGHSLSQDMAYAQSKLALIMWTMFMAEQHPEGPVFIAVNPKSFLGSKMVREAYGKQGYNLGIGADILRQAALDAAFATANGKYFDNDYEEFREPHPFALSHAHRSALIKLLDTF